MKTAYKKMLVLCVSLMLLGCTAVVWAGQPAGGQPISGQPSGKQPAFEAPIREASYLSAAAAQANAEAKSPVTLFVGIVLAPAVIAALVCLGAASGMRNVRQGSSVSSYVDPEGLTLDKKRDRFSHRTQTRTKIERKDTPSRG